VELARELTGNPAREMLVDVLDPSVSKPPLLTN